MEELSFDNILSGDELEDLFTNPENTETGNTETPAESGETKEQDTTEVNVDTLFTEPEGVSSVGDNQGEEDTKSLEDGTSPKTNFYSSIAAALRDEGILSFLDENRIKEIKSPEDFVKAMEEDINSRLDEKQQRIDRALGLGVEPDEIKRYENTLSYLESIQDDVVKDESEKGETIRKQLIFQDFINRGFSEERAKREVARSFSSGTDIEDAIEALNSNKEFFKQSYQDLIEDAKAAEEEETKARKKRADELKKEILETEEPFEGVKLDKVTRQKVYDNITKPVYKDSDGNYYTAIQKYEMENKAEFLKNLGVIFTLTNGFKTFDPLVNKIVKKETRKAFREIEHVLNSTARNPDGSLRYASGVDAGPESKLTLDV